MTEQEISLRVKSILAEIRLAAEEAGRNPEEVLLLAATKMNDPAAIQAAIHAGVGLCGENRVQEMLEKSRQNAYAGAELHFIGHLQKNKVRQVVGLCSLIHSADSLPLLEEIDRVAEKRGLRQDVLLEVNIGGEPSKSGFRPEEIPEALSLCAKFSSLSVRGLMTIPPVCRISEDNREFFLKMRQLFIDNGQKKYDNVSMDFLSMGMSGDYAEAVRCGANLVRVGSGIFGPRNY